MLNFGLIGVGGYIAPRHLKAIKETGSNLVASVDINDSVGIIDQYFPHSNFSLDLIKFGNSILNSKLDFISICSPNYLHQAHIKFTLEKNINAICEKPVCLTPCEIDSLANLENETGRKIFTILQLRHHPGLKAFKETVKQEKQKQNVILTYITGRGNWYNSSWKGNPAKSGGIATNIGIHLFDLLIWLYGNVEHSEVHLSAPDKMAGFLELENAQVEWFLSIDFKDIPDKYKEKKNTYRSITINDNELEFSEGFTDLHTVVYQDIISGSGFGIEDARPSIELVDRIRNQFVSIDKEKMHPFAKKILNIL